MSRNKKVISYEKHPLLDETCRNYIESAINCYHQIATEVFAHIDFLFFWFNGIIDEATPENSMRSTVNYFIGKNTSNKLNTQSKTYAEEYFKKILKHYNNLCDRDENEKEYIEGKRIFEWIRGLRSKKPKNYIKTENIDWLPVLKTKDKWSKKEQIIANELQFGWSISRLWQLLRSRKKEKYIRVFLGGDTWECNAQNLKKKHIPEELKKSLMNNNSEEMTFFDKYLHFFSPEYLSNDELCAFFKKACFSSINERSLSNAYRQPLDKIWLLARFFNIHSYSLDFIDNPSGRGISSRAVKQFEMSQTTDLMQSNPPINLARLIDKDFIKMGSKRLPVEEVLSTLVSKGDLFKIKKEKTDLSEKNLNGLLDGYFLNYLSFPNIKGDSKELTKAKKSTIDLIHNDPNLYKTRYFSVSFLDFALTQAQSYKNKYKNELQILEPSRAYEVTDTLAWDGIKKFIYISYISWSLEHKKNLFLLANNDIPEIVWKKMDAISQDLFWDLYLIHNPPILRNPDKWKQLCEKFMKTPKCKEVLKYIKKNYGKLS